MRLPHLGIGSLGLGAPGSALSGRNLPCPFCRSSNTTRWSEAEDRQGAPPQRRWSVCRCRDCAIGWTHPCPGAEEIRRAYPPGYLGDVEKTLDDFGSGRLQKSRSWRNEVDKVRLVEKFCGGGRLLDVGCADGKFLWALDPRRWERWGVEFLEDTVITVSRRLPDLNLIAGDVWSPELDGQSFDVVTLWHVFEHLPRPRQTLMRLRELLRSGGSLFLAVPNLDSLQARLFKSHWLGLDVPRHLYHYTPFSMRDLLGGVGFVVERTLWFPFRANIHHLKHSLLHWSEERLRSRIPYYLLKWSLFPFDGLERLCGRYGMLLMIVRRP